MPPPSWPDVPCPAGSPVTTARDLLDSILAMAAAAGAPNFDQISVLVDHCKANGPIPYPLDPAHCILVERAQFFAGHGMWYRCAEELDHGHI